MSPPAPGLLDGLPHREIFRGAAVQPRLLRALLVS